MTSDETEPTLWAGWIMFTSLVMMLLGAFHLVQGLVALVRSEVFVVGRSDLPIEVDYATWGWAHVVFGAVLLATGIAVLFGQVWARLTGVAIAMGSALVNLAFLATHPAWSLVMIVMDVLVIWTLTVHGDEMKAARERAR